MIKGMKRAYYIKLGAGGEWDDYCLREMQVLRIGYKEIDHNLCETGKSNWDRKVLDQCRKIVKGGNTSAAKNHVKQLRAFYEADAKDTIWITFSGGCLWWCIAGHNIRLLDTGDKVRDLHRHWSCTDLKEKPLTFGSLNGRLLATKGFRQTICEVKEFEYLIAKLNGTVQREISEAANALSALASSLVPLIKKLNDKDFEVLIDLLFRQGGFYRTGELGGTQKDIDLDLINPISGEKIAVQAKSSAKEATYKKYVNIFTGMPGGYTRFVFATHSPEGRWPEQPDSRTGLTELWLADKIAEQAVRLGLAGWIIDKAI